MPQTYRTETQYLVARNTKQNCKLGNLGIGDIVAIFGNALQAREFIELEAKSNLQPNEIAEEVDFKIIRVVVQVFNRYQPITE